MDNHKLDKVLSDEQFIRREYSLSRLTYEREFSFYEAVKEGDWNKVKSIMLPLKSEGLGKLSDNELRNLKYHLVITIALITRFCIEGGLQPGEAYSLSDIFIQKLDVAAKESEIADLHLEAVREYTLRMESLKHKNPYSRPVSLVVDYVYEHLHEKISLSEMADSVSYGKTYLCDVFRKETGFTIGEYILERKIEAAKNMLRYSDYSSSDIGNYLGFSSHSHFIAVFKKVTGETPREYRNANFRKEFHET